MDGRVVVCFVCDGGVAKYGQGDEAAEVAERQ